MRLSDAGLRRGKSEALYPDHPFPPWLTEATTPRSLQPTVRRLFIAGERPVLLKWPALMPNPALAAPATDTNGRSQIHVRALLGVIAHPGLTNTPALEWNSYAKRNHGAQDNCVNKNKRVWNH